jgi:hypothetical protein
MPKPGELISHRHEEAPYQRFFRQQGAVSYLVGRPWAVPRRLEVR